MNRFNLVNLVITTLLGGANLAILTTSPDPGWVNGLAAILCLLVAAWTFADLWRDIP